MTPQFVGRYEIFGLLGKGGIGQVYEARDTQLGRIVALKGLRTEYSADPAFMARFQAEAAALANLSHPNITGLYDLLEADGQLYMVMELVRGHTLEAVLARCRRLDVREALAAIAQTAAGLSYAHSKDVIHRDIKPSNLMLTENGLLKIMDFGIARVRGSQRLTRAGSIVGTLTYAAPEQIKGSEGDEQSDVYSLGCVLYEMLSGGPPFEGETDYALIKAHVEARPVPLGERISRLPLAVEQALMRALAKEPGERFASVGEFSNALGAEAVQAQAAEIIRTNVLPVAGPIVSQPKPILSRSSDASAAQSPSGRSSVRRDPQQSEPRPRRGQESGRHPPASSRMPAIVLGSTVVALTLGLAYFIWDQNPLSGSVHSPPQPHPQQQEQAIAPPNGILAPSDTPTQPELKLAVITTPSQADAGAVAPNHADRRLTTENTEPPMTHHNSLFIPEASRLDATVSSQNSLLLPNSAPTDAPKPLASLAPAPEKPTYQGKVINWVVADLLVVFNNGSGGKRPLRLFGITSVDQTDNAAQAQSHRAQLNAFLATYGGVVICYDRGGGEFQCFAGDQDIALWAVKHDLARLSNDAPADYREAAAK